eukprot:2240002-Prymnesium_polylepis.1
MGSHGVTWGHMGSHGVTWAHLDGLQVDQVEVTQPLDLAARAARQRVEGAYGARAVDAGRRRL